MTTTADEVAIIGAGLAGSLTACFLAERGVPVRLYERRADPRLGDPPRGRSINLALSERGLDALRRINLDQEVLADALPMRGRMVHPIRGELDFQPYSTRGDRAINSISRGALNNRLLDAATLRPHVTVHFDHELRDLDPSTGSLTFETPNGQTRTQAKVIIGADGAGSAVRAALCRAGLFVETVDMLDHGYRELRVPPTADGDFALDPGALHIWPRGSSMMIALPNPDRSFTCTLFWPRTEFDALDTPDAIGAHFAAYYPDLPPLAPDLIADYQHNPLGSLGTVRCTPWQTHGRVVLLGDAAHAMVPFFGQGANCAFEDVVELDRCLRENGGSWPRTLPIFERRRMANARAIAEMALDNFVEMRDKVASPWFRLGRRIEHTLQRALPGVYLSRYEQVSFSTRPYAAVRRRARVQHVLAGLTATAALTGTIAAVIRRRR